MTTQISDQGCCLNCPYWTGQADAVRGHCRRNPPQAAIGVAALWPVTTPRDWCGAHPARVLAAQRRKVA